MKTKLILASVILSIISFAEPVKVGWDPMANVDGFRIYQGDELLVEVGLATETVLDISPSGATITATAFNVRGESKRSDPLTIPPLPPEVKMVFTVNIEGEIKITIKPKIVEPQ